MPGLTRRTFLATASAGVAAGLLARPALAQGAPRVVIIGGGFGGATLARSLRRIDPGIEVTLVERDARFTTCPFSNHVLAGLRPLDSISFGYEAVAAAGVTVVNDSAASVDPEARIVRLAGGQTLSYDRLVMAPGIQLAWGGIEAYDQAAAERMPHAWLAGAQTMLLRRQLEAMEDGGLVVIAVPDNPYRCPPGPYERASLVAWYLKQNKPKSKLLILDAKDRFSKQPLFTEAWEALYPGLIEWVPGSQSGKVIAVDPARMAVMTDFEEFAPAVANIIPPQKAGEIALSLQLDAGKGFCPVDPHSFESTVQPGIHLVGDAIIPGAMPKSGFAANSQAKVAARAIAGLLRDRAVEDAILLNTCYSTAAPDYGFSVANVFRQTDEGLVEVEESGGTSPLDAPAETRKAEARYAESWYANITSEIFA